MPSQSVPCGHSSQQNHEPHVQGNLDSPELAQNAPNTSVPSPSENLLTSIVPLPFQLPVVI